MAQEDEDTDVGSDEWVSVAKVTTLFNSVFKWERVGGEEGTEEFFFEIDHPDWSITITPCWDEDEKLFTSFEVDAPEVNGYGHHFEFDSLAKAQMKAEEIAMTILHDLIQVLFKNPELGLKEFSEFDFSKR